MRSPAVVSRQYDITDSHRLSTAPHELSENLACFLEYSVHVYVILNDGEHWHPLRLK